MTAGQADLAADTGGTTGGAHAIRVADQSACPICESLGHPVYSGLVDMLYSAPGSWSMSRCDNPACEAYWLSEMPLAEDLWIAYRDYYTHQTIPASNAAFKTRVKQAFVKRRFGYPAPKRPWLALLDLFIMAVFPRHAEAAYYEHFYLPWQPGGRLLEIGCGAGNQLLTLKQAGWTVCGVDFDPAAVEAAQARGLDVRMGDVRDMHFVDGAFDAIVMGHVIEHVYDPVALLAECRRLLAPSGVVVVITPNAESIGHRAFGRDWRGLEPPRHIVVFTPKALQLAFQMAGLAPDRTRFSARDASNMLRTSAKIRDTVKASAHAGISSPVLLRWHLLYLAGLERLGAWLHRGWAEEQILIGRRLNRQPKALS